MNISSTIQSFFERYWLSIPWEMILSDILSKLISLVFLWILFLISKKILHKVFQKTVLSSIQLSSQSIARKQTLMRLLENGLDYLLYFVLIYWILMILGIPITSLLAGAGIAGVAIGLGAQGFLSDVVNGLFILLERQYDVGDTVIIGAVTGTVASVGVRTTQVRGFDGTLHFIPNRSISVVSNQSRGDMRALIEIPLYNDVDLTIVYDTVDQVIQAFLQKENLHNQILDYKSPSILLRYNVPQYFHNKSLSSHLHCKLQNLYPLAYKFE